MSIIDDIKHKVEEVVGGHGHDMVDTMQAKADDAVDHMADMVKTVTPDSIDGMVDNMADKVSDMVENTADHADNAAEAMTHKEEAMM